MPSTSLWELTQAIQQQIDSILAPWNSHETPGMAIGISQNGELIHTQAVGMANLEHDIPITPQSIFHIASISKQFTCTCIALLAAEGALDVDDDIRIYIPEVPDFGPTITIRHLMHHVSGLRDQWTLLRLAGWREEDLVTEGDVMDLVQRQQALNFEPNSEYLYSNTGYTLLSVIVKRVSGKSLRQFSHQRIFEPLGMSRTHFHDDHSEIVRGRTQAYLPRTGGGYHISIPEFDVVGTTSLFTTVEDLAKWDANYLHTQVGGPEIISQLQTPGTFSNGTAMEYGWGLRVVPWRGTHRVGHGGADHGYRADFLRLPEFGLTVSVLSNVSNSMPGALSEKIAAAILGDLLPAETETTISPRAIAGQIPASISPAALAGTWHSADGHAWLDITARDGKAWIASSPPIELTPLGLGQFAGDLSHPVATFGLRLQASTETTTPETLEVTFAGTTQTYDRQPRHIPSVEDIAPLAGSYWSDELGVPFDITTDAHDPSGSIVLHRRKFEDATYTPLAPDVFGRGSLEIGTSITFQRSENGTVTGFAYTEGRVRNLVFTRR